MSARSPRGPTRARDRVDASALEPWPRPRIALVRDREALAELVAALVATRPAALGLCVTLNPSATPGPPDPRRDAIDRIALACPAPDDGDATVHLIADQALDALAQLEPALAPEGGRPPYVVLDDAHRALAALAPRGLWPARYGCARIAASLLSEGTGARARTLHDLVARALERSLPGGLDGGVTRAELGAPHDEVLACAAATLVPLMRALTPRLRARELTRVFELECELLPAVVRMEAAGVGVDVIRFEQIVSAWRAERRDLTSETDDSEAALAARSARLARLDKLISTFGHWPRDHVELDGRIRYHLDPIGADSGRFACSQPNLQQVPSEHTAPGVRACFIPAAGNALIIADYAQIELRVAAHVARCEAMTRVFREGRDPHRATAAGLARKPEAEVTDHERKLAKAINFGFLFGMGARRFREYARASYDLELDPVAAERAREAFFATYPGISAWHRRVGALERRAATRDIVVRTALGRRKRFRAGAFSFNAALNIPVQGTAAEGFKLAMIELEPVLADLGGRGVLCVHDEYIAEVPGDRAEEARDRIRQAMERAMAQVVTSVPIVVDAKIGASWADGK